MAVVNLVTSRGTAPRRVVRVVVVARGAMIVHSVKIDGSVTIIGAVAVGPSARPSVNVAKRRHIKQLLSSFLISWTTVAAIAMNL